MIVEDLNDRAVKKNLLTILSNLSSMVEDDHLEVDVQRDILLAMVESFQDLDNCDALGTEGWEANLLGK